MIKGDQVVRKGLLEEVMFVQDQRREDPGEKRSRWREGQGQRSWGRGAPGVFVG